MSDLGMQDKDDLSESMLRSIDQVCDEFELELQQERRPRIEDFLANCPGLDRSKLLRELLQVDLEYYSKRGERPVLEEFFEHFPEDRDRAVILDVIRGEDTVVPPAGVKEATRPSTSPQAPTEWPPKIGGFGIQRELGRGGMGIVLMAWDPAFERTLAIKILAPRHAKDPDWIDRFREEAKIMGKLQHSGIPPVHVQGKLDDDRPYFAMKLIKGKTLAALLKDRESGTGNWARGKKGLGSDETDEPNKNGGSQVTRRGSLALTTDAKLLGIFAKVCQTVAYAHDRGIIHRDLKPDNIMVDDFGEVQVMDWGLAKVITPGGRCEHARENALTVVAQGKASATGMGVLVGTPAYMAPEQARCEQEALDERCDVFGLGAILCELLTGKPPFSQGSVPERLMRAKAGDLKEAFDHLDECGSDAELIELARHCLAPQKEDRPRDAGQVAAAVERYQAAVQERLRQAELEKEKAQIQAQEERKRREAEHARAEEACRRQEAEAARARAERRWRRMTAATAVLGLVLVAGAASGVLWHQQVQAARSAEHGRRVQSIEDALAQARALRARLRDQLARQGGVFKLLNSPQEWSAQIAAARSAWQRAKDLEAGTEDTLEPDLQDQIQKLAAQLQNDEADRQLALQLEKIHEQRSTIIEGKFNDTNAEQEYARAFRQAQVGLRPGQEKEYAALVRQSPIKEQLLAALDDWAWVARVTRKHDLQRRLLQIARQADPDPWKNQVRDPITWADHQALKKLTDKALTDRALLARLSPQMLDLLGLLLSDRRDEAENWLRQALALHPADFWLNSDLGFILHKARPQQAEGFFRAALAIRRESTAVWNNLGNALFSQKQFQAALAHYDQALQLDGHYAPAWCNRGLAFHGLKDEQAAVAAYRKALEYDDKLVPALMGLGNGLQQHGDFDGAIAAYKKALQIAPANAAVWTNLGNARRGRAAIWQNRGNTPRAQEDVERAIVAYRKALDVNPDVAEAWNGLGNALQDQEDFNGASAAFKKALTINPNLAPVWNGLGNVLTAQRDFPGAVEAYKRALKIDRNYALAWNGLGDALRHQKDLGGAADAFQQAIALEPKFPNAHLGLGFALRDQGSFPAAAASFQQALKLLPRQHPWHKLAQGQRTLCQQLMAQEKRLELVLKSSETPAAEQLKLADLCQRYKNRYRDAVRLYTAAFAGQPQLAEDWKSGNRYCAACAAALAAAGNGEGADQLEDRQKAVLQKQALDWLQADLRVLRHLLPNPEPRTDKGHAPSLLETVASQNSLSPPAAILVVLDKLALWQSDPRLASVRDEKELGKLLTDKQQEWRQLWGDVANVLQQARTCCKETNRWQGSLTDERRHQVHETRMAAGKAYVLDLRSQQFNACLRLEDGLGKQLARNDNSGLGEQSRIVFTALLDGTYRVVVTARQRGTGEYTLLLRELAGKPKRENRK